ncbi:MAG: thymidylate synthase [Acidobacteria bacterium]|nr:MAG: thymidylate synthase [Acidobacteriota bacterium]
MPEVVKGALFARYSRSPKSLRRLFLDEFVRDRAAGVEAIAEEIQIRSDSDASEATERAEALYQRIFTEYGDDSVAQLGGAHVACEDVSNVLTKLVERGRLMSYLEQSTRYIRYDQKVGGRYRFYNPFPGGSGLDARFEAYGSRLFAAYSEMFGSVEAAVRDMYPNEHGDPTSVYEPAVRAKVCDVLRGLLPAATQSSVGIFGSGQAYEGLVMRLLASGNEEAAAYAAMILEELERVIPSFLRRVRIPDRGGRWIEYMKNRDGSLRQAVEALPISDLAPEPETGSGPFVSLTSFDSDGELRIAAAAIFVASSIGDARARMLAAGLSERELDDLFDALLGDRGNRRHRPGREFEATVYRFEVLSDYGAFRDLQRHRMLTIEWQPLGVGHGFTIPDLVEECGLADEWCSLMGEAAEIYCDIPDSLAWSKPYVVPMAFRIRYVMELNAREAMHLIELRTTPQGHEEYRRVCLEMHRLIAEVAGHRRVARAMSFVGGESSALERIEAERRAAERRTAHPR